MTTPETLHVVGFGWQRDGIHLEVRDAANVGATRKLPLTGALRFKRLGRRLCSGWFDFESGERSTCPDNAVPERKSQCEACIEREGYLHVLRLAASKQTEDTTPRERASVLPFSGG